MPVPSDRGILYPMNFNNALYFKVISVKVSPTTSSQTGFHTCAQLATSRHGGRQTALALSLLRHQKERLPGKGGLPAYPKLDLRNDVQAEQQSELRSDR